MKKAYDPMTAFHDEAVLNSMNARALRSTVRWQTSALDAIRDGVLITDVGDADQPLLYANAAFERMTGYTAAEIEGKDCRFLQGPDTDPETIDNNPKSDSTARALFSHDPELPQRGGDVLE